MRIYSIIGTVGSFYQLIGYTKYEKDAIRIVRDLNRKIMIGNYKYKELKRLYYPMNHNELEELIR